MELLLEYHPNRTGGEAGPDTERALVALSWGVEQGKDLWNEEEKLAEPQLERLVRIDHIQTEAAFKITQLAEREEGTQRPPHHAPLKDGDLVLLRRFILDQRWGNKLEARWEGPYTLLDLAWHGKSGRLCDLNTGDVV